MTREDIEKKARVEIKMIAEGVRSINWHLDRLMPTLHDLANFDDPETWSHVADDVHKLAQ